LKIKLDEFVVKATKICGDCGCKFEYQGNAKAISKKKFCNLCSKERQYESHQRVITKMAKTNNGF